MDGPMTWLHMNKEAGVAQNLELLADFVADVPIAGMQLLKPEFPVNYVIDIGM